MNPLLENRVVAILNFMRMTINFGDVGEVQKYTGMKRQRNKQATLKGKRMLTKAKSS